MDRGAKKKLNELATSVGQLAGKVAKLVVELRPILRIIRKG
jgi:outer membrane murein-binding lipoprotein Lpp